MSDPLDIAKLREVAEGARNPDVRANMEPLAPQIEKAYKALKEYR